MRIKKKGAQILAKIVIFRLDYKFYISERDIIFSWRRRIARGLNSQILIALLELIFTFIDASSPEKE